MSQTSCACLDRTHFEFELQVADSCWSEWKRSLPVAWADKYPMLFTGDDVRLARSQPIHHFREWVVAIHFHRHHKLRVLTEKWRLHPWKSDIARLVLGDKYFDRVMRCRSGVPDLLVYDPSRPVDAFFVEVKGRSPSGRLESESRQETTAALLRRLGYDVLVFRVHRVRGSPPKDCLGTAPASIVPTLRTVAGPGSAPGRQRRRR